MRRAAFYSFLLHFAIFLLLFFGLPWFPKDNPPLMRPIPIEVMTVTQETTAPKPAPKAIREEKEPEKEKPAPKPEKETAPPPAEPTPLPQPPEIPEKTEPAPPEPSPPVVEPDPTPMPTKKPEPKKKEPTPEPKSKPVPDKPKDKPKPVEKPKDKKPVEKKKKVESFDSILKNLEEPKEEVENDSLTDPDSSPSSKQVGQVGDKLSISEIDKLGAHFKKCWNIPAGAQGAEDLSVKIKLSITPDGIVKDAEVVDKSRFNTDPYYRSAAETALRAAKDPRCSKLPLSLEILKKYSTLTLNFDPRFLLGG
jgi:hypothetical protein